ncbi:hypothetical protein MFUL124B02_13300 [Myxococcus fulvus 124B02]|nr:hypothetical protein MFUL124B02_13300 [Myxococcus fulvus 124B02]
MTQVVRKPQVAASLSMPRDEMLLGCLWPRARLSEHSPFPGRESSILLEASIERLEVMQDLILPLKRGQAVNGA